MQVAVGQTFKVLNDTREIVGFPNNSNGEPMVAWVSKTKRNTYGVCHPSVLVNWLKGYWSGDLDEG